ncbi:hypothetical protein [Streptomyces sp. SLBN-31]|uniref:hypothetical protein n=1 Tax=Streptomyces sp. SLBN-31 TaxID=2768444 RepID=UPI001150ED87|nr:hypothetical protein [Streptomyces sp. SLBN-31]TQJ90387.1 hypothetical protein FBY22_1169 [Streptomyces sp. SLBN-31]
MPLAPPAPSLPRPGILGRAFGVLFFLIAVVIFGIGIFNAANAAGVIGTHGTLTVKNCWVERGTRHSRGHTVCGGTFRSDDGNVVDEDASISAAVPPGSKVSVQRAADWYVRTGFGEAARWIAMFFLGWLVLAFGMAFAVTGMFPRDAAQVGMITREISDARVGTVRKWIVRGSLAGTAICLLLTPFTGS